MSGHSVGERLVQAEHRKVHGNACRECGMAGRRSTALEKVGTCVVHAQGLQVGPREERTFCGEVSAGLGAGTAQIAGGAPCYGAVRCALPFIV